MAFMMASDLAGPGVTTTHALAAIGGVLPAIEVVDSRIVDWRIQLADTVADNASSARAVLGGRHHPGRRSSTCACSACCSTATARRSTAAPARRCSVIPPAAWPGWPTSSARSAPVCAAATSCCPGRCTGMVPVRPGDVFQARFAHLGTVTAQFSGGDAVTDPQQHRRHPRRRRAPPDARRAVHPAHTRSSTWTPRTRRRRCSSSTGCRRRERHRRQAGYDEQGQAARPRHPRAGIRAPDLRHGDAARRAGPARRADQSRAPNRRSRSSSGERIEAPTTVGRVLAATEAVIRRGRDRRLAVRDGVPAARLGRRQRRRGPASSSARRRAGRTSSRTSTSSGVCSASAAASRPLRWRRDGPSGRRAGLVGDASPPAARRSRRGRSCCPAG